LEWFFILALSFTLETYDALIHMFFAQHYATVGSNPEITAGTPALVMGYPCF
jgi:hypothetical protein